MNDKIKRFIGGLVYILIVMLLLFYGFKQKTYHAYFLFPYYVVISILVGIGGAVPHLINEFEKDGTWFFDWVYFIAIGVPALYVAVSPILYFSPLGKYLPKFGAIMLTDSATPHFICGIIFGYILLSIFNKRTTTEYLADR